VPGNRISDRQGERKRRLYACAVAAVAALALTTCLGAWQNNGAVASAARSDGLRVAHFRVGAAPVAVTASHGSVWVVEETSGLRAELVRLDPTTGKRSATFLIGRTGPDFGAAASSGAFVWAAAGDHVIRVDATQANAVRRARLPGEAATITLGLGSAWVASIGRQHNTITRLDPSTLVVRTQIPLTFQPVAIAAGLGSVWLASSSGLWRIDPTNDHVIPAPVPVALPVGLALAETRLWVLEQDRRAVSIDRAGHIRAQITLPFAPGAFAVTPGRIWVTNNCGCRTGELALLNTITHRLLADQPIGETPVDVAADRSGTWIATFGDETVSHAHSSSS
jgi:DNA-binding beta-propeller fold protein YncE